MEKNSKENVFHSTSYPTYPRRFVNDWPFVSENTSKGISNEDQIKIVTDAHEDPSEEEDLLISFDTEEVIYQQQFENKTEPKVTSDTFFGDLNKKIEHHVASSWQINPYQPVFRSNIPAEDTVDIQADDPEEILSEDEEPTEFVKSTSFAPTPVSLLSVPKNQKSNFLNQEAGKDKAQPIIEVILADRHQQFQKIIYYRLKGTYRVSEDITTHTIYRRYNDFKRLQVLLANEFYYKVLPKLPEKNILYKIKTTRRMLDQRARALESYLNKLLKIEEVASHEYLELFLTQEDEFQWMLQRPEVAAVIKRDGFVESATNTISTVWNTLKSKERFDDPGFYAVFAKEIDTLYLFVKGTLESFVKLQENMKNIYTHVNAMGDICNQLGATPGKGELTESKFTGQARSKLDPNSQKLAGLIASFTDLFEQIQSCKEALIRKDKIYKEFEQAKASLKTSKPNQAFGGKENGSVLATTKEKVEILERFFKPELKGYLTEIKKKLEDVFSNQMESALSDMFKI